MIAQIFHSESFEAEKCYQFVYFQEVEMTEEQIDCEDVAKERIDGSASKIKRIQNKKRRDLLKRFENSQSN